MSTAAAGSAKTGVVAFGAAILLVFVAGTVVTVAAVWFVEPQVLANLVEKEDRVATFAIAALGFRGRRNTSESHVPKIRC